MATKGPRLAHTAADSVTAPPRDVRVSAELADEILGAMAEIDSGEFLELTQEQLARAATTGDLPWSDDEFRD